jgi:hypothetical protein
LSYFWQYIYYPVLNTKTNSDSSNEDDALCEDRIGLDAEKDVCFASYISLDIVLAICVLSSFEELCDDHEFGRSSNE